MIKAVSCLAQEALAKQRSLVIERPGKPNCLIEIKSATQITRSQLASFIRLSRDLPESEAICLSCDPFEKQIDHVRVLPWQVGIKQLFVDSRSGPPL